MSIRNDKAEALIRRIAAETGESYTDVIIQAMEEKMARLRGTRAAPLLEEELTAIAKRCAGLPDLDSRSPEEILGYNDYGSF